MRGIEEKPGKKAMRLHSEQQAGPRRGKTATAKAVLNRRKAERGGKSFWDAEQLDRDVASRWGACIAHQPLLPREAIMRSLCPGKERRLGVWLFLARRAELAFYTLVAHELHAGTAMR